MKLHNFAGRLLEADVFQINFFEDLSLQVVFGEYQLLFNGVIKKELLGFAVDYQLKIFAVLESLRYFRIFLKTTVIVTEVHGKNSNFEFLWTVALEV